MGPPPPLGRSVVHQLASLASNPKDGLVAYRRPGGVPRSPTASRRAVLPVGRTPRSIPNRMTIGRQALRGKMGNYSSFRGQDPPVAESVQVGPKRRPLYSRLKCMFKVRLSSFILLFKVREKSPVIHKKSGWKVDFLPQKVAL